MGQVERPGNSTKMLGSIIRYRAIVQILSAWTRISDVGGVNSSSRHGCSPTARKTVLHLDKNPMAPLILHLKVQIRMSLAWWLIANSPFSPYRHLTDTDIETDPIHRLAFKDQQVTWAIHGNCIPRVCSHVAISTFDKIQPIKIADWKSRNWAIPYSYGNTLWYGSPRSRFKTETEVDYWVQVPTLQCTDLHLLRVCREWSP